MNKYRRYHYGCTVLAEVCTLGEGVVAEVEEAAWNDSALMQYVCVANFAGVPSHIWGWPARLLRAGPIRGLF